MSLANTTPHHRAHALQLHREFIRVERAIRVEHLTQKDAIANLALNLRDVTYPITTNNKVTSHHTPAPSAKTLTTKLRKWRAGGRTVEAILPAYTGGTEKCPPELTKEIQRLATLTTGGRDKHGSSPASVVYNSLKADWAQGKSIAGLGTWQEWWMLNHGTELPPKAPDFPYHKKTIDRKIPNKYLRSLGNIGAPAAKKNRPYITLNYSNLRRSELYTLDDVRLDILCIDERTGRAVTVVAYILMEASSRSIPAWVLKPKQALKSGDVDELLAYGLQSPGYGIGSDYTTHIIFERGAVACSEAAQANLEGATDGGIKVHRTGMEGEIRWAGAAADQAVGNSLGKAIIESFNRRLHHALIHLPGQRGNNYENQPSNLGLISEKQTSGTGKGKSVTERDSNRGQSLVREAEKLARINILHNASAKTPAQRIHLHLPMLYLSQLRAAVKTAIDTHNHESGHAYQGHGTHWEKEIAPNVWQETA